MKKIIFVLSTLIILSCDRDDESCTPPNVVEKDIKSILRVVNGDFHQSSIITPDGKVANIQVLTFDSTDVCTKVIPFNKIEFDLNNIFETPINVPANTKSITVFGNALNYTYPLQNEFITQKLSHIFFSTTRLGLAHKTYFFQPNMLYEGTSKISRNQLIEGALINVPIIRVVSNIVVRLNSKLDFNNNNGEGFDVENTTIPIRINDIDSIFIVNTPMGLNATFTEYLGDVGFDFCQIFKVSTFISPTSRTLSDNIIVFPQINAQQLPYIILSVKGTKGNAPISKLYYGMQINSTVSTPNGPLTLKSLPRNSVLIVTVDAFNGNGTIMHPDPSKQGNVELQVSLMPWGDIYDTNGDMD